MDEHEKMEYNDIESLAAYLHSGKKQEERAAEERSEMGLPPEPAENGSGNELEGVLFSIEGRNRQNSITALLDDDEYGADDEDDDDIPERHLPRQAQTDPSIPANPISKAAAGIAPAAKPPRKKRRDDGDSGSFADKAKSRFDSIVSGARKKIEYIREKPDTLPDEEEESFALPEKQASFHRPAVIPAPETETEAGNTDKSAFHEKPRREKAFKPAPEPKAEDQEEEVPALAASLSAALGEKAAQIVRKNKNALPPEDIPEIYDVEEGSDEEEEFDNTATRLMNAVNDPKSRNSAMREDMEAEEEDMRAEKIVAARMRLNYERQKQSTRTLAYILVALLLCAAILGAAAYASTYIVKWALDFTGVASADFKIDVTIPDDADIETVAAILSENNVISDAKFFKMYADFADKIKGSDTKKDFIPGKYTVSSTMSYSTLLSILRTKVNTQKTVTVRIVEGMTAREIGELLEENNICFAEDFEKYYKNIQNKYDFERRVKENSLKFNQLEGYLFPDTYEFYVVNSMETGGKPEKGQTVDEAYEKMKKESEENALEAAKKMYSNFNSKMTRSMYKKMGEMHFTLDDTVALASIVQKEAASEEDMGMVASVFLNRIRSSAEYPYLQSDVTVLYVENDIKPYIKGSDASKQRIYDAYNTYTCHGIPAGAVCNPGEAAINAVLYAPETPYYYFCANKETGEIYYAATQAEHEANLRLAGLTAGEQTSPMPYGEGEEGNGESAE